MGISMQMFDSVYVSKDKKLEPSDELFDLVALLLFIVQWNVPPV